MALDRFVYWKKRKPTKKEVRAVLTNFLGGVGSIRWNKDRFFITLPGEQRAALKGFVRNAGATLNDARWIEVWFDSQSLDIMTRQADEFTSALASELAKIFARFWEGKLDED